jgi:hypothetical protein
VRLSRLSRRGLLLGCSGPQLAVLAVGLVAMVGGLLAGGGTGLLATAPLWVGAPLVAWLPIGGRPVIGWLPTVAVWAWRRAIGQTIYRRQVLRLRPEGTLALPGDAAAMRHHTDPLSGAVMVHDPHHKRLIAIARVTHRSFLLLDPVEQARRVQAWGRVLAGACRSGRIGRVQVLERTLPGSGTDLLRWWSDHGRNDRSWPARTYDSLIGRAGPAAERHVTTISIAIDLRAAARPIRSAGSGLHGAATVLRQEMTSLAAALTAADLAPISWLDAADLADVLRSAYDPQHPGDTDHSGPAASTRQDRPVEAGVEAAGPMALVESWDALRSDSAHHAVLWIAGWPQSAVATSFLAPLLLSSGVTRAFTLLCQPIPADRAVRQIRRAKTEHLADAAQRARIGQVEDLRDTAEFDDVLQREAELTGGHGLLRYAGLLAITAPTATALQAAVAEVEQAAVQACCDTRRLVGQQAQAFVAAALPLCRGL